MTDSGSPCTTEYCGLCMFKFEPGSFIVAGELSSKFLNRRLMQLSPKPSVQPQSFAFRRNCYPSCPHRNGLTAAFHDHCYFSWAPVPITVTNATTGTFFYPPKYPTADSIRRTVAQRLAQSYKLSLEICQYIGNRLTGLYNAATVTLSRPTQAKAVHADLSQDIWACFIKFHHGIYIQSLSNVRGTSSRDSMWVLVRKGADRSDTLYLARDSWGVRGIKFAHRSDRVSSDDSSDIWWTSMPILPSSGSLLGPADVRCLLELVNQASY